MRARQVRRRRALALAVLGLALAGIAYLVLAVTLLAPADRHGAERVHLSLESEAMGRELGVDVVVPAGGGPAEGRGLLVFLHGRGGSESTYSDDQAFFDALAGLGRRAPLVAFPDGGDHGYWHDRAEGRWGRYVTGEVIPAVARRFGADPRRVAIGGISMGGFGAYDLALRHPGRFCAVGGHSPALWFEGGETAPGAFDDAEDFARHDVVGAVRADPGAFGPTRIWNDYGDADPFRPYDEGFLEALGAGGVEVSAHTWPGEHEIAYWDRHWRQYLRFYADALADC